MKSISERMRDIGAIDPQTVRALEGASPVSMAAGDYRFGDVCRALEVTPKALRKWLQRHPTDCPGVRAGGWYAFTPLDIALLAIAGQLVRFGVDVKRALRFARVAFELPSGAQPHRDADALDIVAAMWGRRLVILSNRGELHATLFTGNNLPVVFDSSHLSVKVQLTIREAFVRVGIATP